MIELIKVIKGKATRHKGIKAKAESQKPKAESEYSCASICGN